MLYYCDLDHLFRLFREFGIYDDLRRGLEVYNRMKEMYGGDRVRTFPELNDPKFRDFRDGFKDCRHRDEPEIEVPELNGLSSLLRELKSITITIPYLLL